MAIRKSRRVSVRICAVRQVDPETLSADPLHIRQAARRSPPHFFYDAGVQGLAFCHEQESQSPSHRHPEHDGAGNNYSRCRHWDESPSAVDLPPVSPTATEAGPRVPARQDDYCRIGPFWGRLPPAEEQLLCSRARRNPLGAEHRPYRGAATRLAASSTISAARSAGALEPISMILSSLENASSCCRRWGVSSNNGNNAAASRSAVQLYWSSSGTTFSPSKRLVKMIEGSRFRIPRPTA